MQGIFRFLFPYIKCWNVDFLVLLSPKQCFNSLHFGKERLAANILSVLFRFTECVYTIIIFLILSSVIFFASLFYVTMRLFVSYLELGLKSLIWHFFMLLFIMYINLITYWNKILYKYLTTTHIKTKDIWFLIA